MNAGRGHVIHVQEFAHRRAAAPHHHIRCVLGSRLVETTQQRRDHVRVARVEVIVRPVQVGRHHRAIVTVVLTVVGLAQLDPGNFGNRVRLVGCFQRPLQQFALGDRLFRHFRVDTG